MTNNTRSYLNNKVWYRLLKVVYIFAISIICIIIWFFIYNDTEYKDITSIEINYPTTNKLISHINNSINRWEYFDIDNFKKSNREFENIKANTLKDLTDDIWNVISEWREIEPKKLQQLYPELFYKNTKEYINTIDNAIGELWATILSNPNDDLAIIKSKFPEFSNLDEQVFWELWATLIANPDLSMEEIRQKFPELDNPDFIKNYSWVDTIITQKGDFINPNIKITLILIWKFILIIWIAYLISELLKRVLYYIVLWSFNPKK